MKGYVLWLKIKGFLVAVILAMLLLFREDIPKFIEVGAYAVFCCGLLILSLTKLVLFARFPKAGYILSVITSCILCIFALGWCALSFVVVPFAPILLIPIVGIGGMVVAYNSLLVYRCLKQAVKHN